MPYYPNVVFLIIWHFGLKCRIIKVFILFYFIFNLNFKKVYLNVECPLVYTRKTFKYVRIFVLKKYAHNIT